MDFYHTKKQTEKIPRSCSYLLLKTLNFELPFMSAINISNISSIHVFLVKTKKKQVFKDMN